jgi:hypothetical protein
METPKTPQSLFDDAPEPTAPPAPTPSAPRPPTPPPAPPEDDKGIGMGRVIRMFLLLIVLCIVVGMILAKTRGGAVVDANAPDATLDDDAATAIADAVAQMHKAIREENTADGRDAYDTLAKYKARGRRATKARIAFHMLFYLKSTDPRSTAQHMDQVATLFEGIMPIVLSESTISSLNGALNDYANIAEAAAAPDLNQDRDFLRSASTTWRLARRRSEANQTPKRAAEVRLQWMALHTAPEAADKAAGISPLVFERGYANAVQAAWAFAEPLRQMNITCRAVALPAVDGADQPECLVQVYDDGEPVLLVNPWRAVPVLHPQTTEPITYDMIKADPALYADFLKTAGLEWTASGDALQDRELCDPVNPRAFFPRVHALDSLLDDISPRPVFALNLRGLPDAAQPTPWLELLDEMRRMRSADAVRDAALAGNAVSTFSATRWDQIADMPGTAASLRAVRKRIGTMLEVADMPEGKEALLEARRMLAIFIPIADFDAGNLEDAAEALPAVAEDERWGVLAQTVLAEALTAEGKPAKLDALPHGRRLYGILRAKGLIPAPPQPEPEPEPEPDPEPEPQEPEGGNAE